MIKCDFGNLEVSGKRSVIMAEYSCLTNSLLEHLGEDDLRHAFESGCKGYDKVAEDMNPKIKKAVSDLLKAIIGEDDD